MGRLPCCNKVGIKKGPWTPEEDIILVSYIQQHGPGNWRAVPITTGLLRCSKSCRLRWTNYLRPGIKRGNFTLHEEGLIIHLQALLGNKWAAIASHLPQRTDNDIKNYWNTHLKKKLKRLGTGSESILTSESEAFKVVSKRFNHGNEKGINHVSSYPRLQQNSSNVVYASSAENISRLLEGWKRSTKVNKVGINETGTSWAANTVQCYKPQIEKLELNKTKVEFEPILSNENVINLRWDKSPCNVSEKDHHESSGEEVQNLKTKMDNNNNNPFLSFFDNWLLYETMGQVDELMELPSDFKHTSFS